MFLVKTVHAAKDNSARSRLHGHALAAAASHHVGWSADACTKRMHVILRRLQPVFLMKTAPVSADAAAALIPAVTTDLARTIARPTSELAK